MPKFKNNLLFDYLSNILTDKSLDLYKEHINDVDEFKSFPKFMILKYLTMSSSEEVRNHILFNYETLERMPNNILYKFLIMNIPRQKTKFIKFLK